MKLRNTVNVKNNASPILISYSFLGAIVVGLLTLVYFNFNSSVSMASASATKAHKAKVTGEDFRVLQNGTPIMAEQAVSVNSEAIFNVQVREGVEFKKMKSTPIATEVSLLRGEAKVSTLKFENVSEMKSKNLQSWINSHYQSGDKIAIELFNTMLDNDEAIKVFSLVQ